MQDFSFEVDPPFDEGADHYDTGDWADSAVGSGETDEWGTAYDEEPTVVASDGFGQGEGEYDRPVEHRDYPHDQPLDEVAAGPVEPGGLATIDVPEEPTGDSASETAEEIDQREFGSPTLGDALQFMGAIRASMPEPPKDDTIPNRQMSDVTARKVVGEGEQIQVTWHHEADRRPAYPHDTEVRLASVTVLELGELHGVAVQKIGDGQGLTTLPVSVTTTQLPRSIKEWPPPSSPTPCCLPPPRAWRTLMRP